MPLENIRNHIKHDSHMEPIGDKDIQIMVSSKIEAGCTNTIPNAIETFGFKIDQNDEKGVRLIENFLCEFTDNKLIDDLRKASCKDFVEKFSENLQYNVRHFGSDNYARKVAVDDLILHILYEMGFNRNLIDEIAKINHEVLFKNKDFLKGVARLCQKQ